MIDSPEALIVLLTSSARVAMVSAIWLDVLTIASVSSCERPTMVSTIASDFSEKSSVTRSSRDDTMSSRPRAISANSSPIWSVLKFKPEVSWSLANAIAREVSSLAASSRASRSSPRSLSCWIMLSLI